MVAVIHHVFANRSNVGDLLSARGIQQLLGDQPVEHLCDDPFVEETGARLQALGPEDVVVVGGGGLVMDYFAELWRGLDDARFRARLILWGIGACDLRYESSRPPLDLVRRVARRAELCVPRDELTRELLDCATPPVTCPSVVSMPRPTGPGNGLLHVVNYTTVGAEAYGVMRAAGRQYASTSGEPYVETDNRIASPDLLAAAVQGYHAAGLVLSSALHGCILAVACGIPVLAVSGDHKIDQFMTAAGLADWVLDSSDVGDLASRLRELPRQPGVPEFVEAAIQTNRAVAEDVRGLLGGTGRGETGVLTAVDP